jgi:hypothetical protein
VSAPYAEAGFGVSPGIIEEDRLVPGSTIERTIYLVQGNQDSDMDIKVSVESPDITEWITFPKGTEFTIPSRQQQFPLDVIIKVPEKAKLGLYNAFIRINTVPKRVEDSQVTIALGGKVTVKLEVGDDIVSDFRIESINILDISEGKSPKINVRVVNIGNVPVAPENASFELFNKYGEIRLAYGENNDFERVPAFQSEETVLEFPLDVKLGVGEYWGHVKIYSNGKVVKELRTVFNVLPRGFFAQHLVSSLLVLAFIITIGFFIRKRVSRSIA